MPLLDCKVGFCKGEPSPDIAPCERGGLCPRSLDLDSLKANEVRKRTVAAVTEGDARRLSALLREAADAHHNHEERTGRPDEDWPLWYASYLLGATR